MTCLTRSLSLMSPTKKCRLGSFSASGPALSSFLIVQCLASSRETTPMRSVMGNRRSISLRPSEPVPPKMRIPDILGTVSQPRDGVLVPRGDRRCPGGLIPDLLQLFWGRPGARQGARRIRVQITMEDPAVQDRCPVVALPVEALEVEFSEPGHRPELAEDLTHGVVTVQRRELGQEGR